MEFADLVALFETIDTTSKRGEKTAMVAERLSRCDPDEIEPFILLLQGRVFPVHDTRKLGISVNYIIKALERVSGYTKEEITARWSKLGDIGTVAEELLKKKKQSTLFSSTISIHKIFTNLQKLPTTTGSGAVEQKMQLIADLLTGCDPQQAKYMIRIILEVLRVGIGEGILRDAIVWAYYPKLDALATVANGKIVYSNALMAGIDEPADILAYKDILTKLKTITVTTLDEARRIRDAKEVDLVLTGNNHELCREIYTSWIDDVQHAIDITNDIAQVAALCEKRNLASMRVLTPTVGKPLQVMLAKKAADTADAFEMVGTPCYVEYKYDGFRMQIHVDGPKIKLFTRKLEEVTAQFPDVVASVATHVTAKSCIIDAEAVGFDKASGKYTPFQHISQRIRRKYEIHQLARDLPVEVNIFDILYLDGANLIDTPLSTRRQLLTKIIKEEPKVLRLSKLLEIETGEQAHEKAQKFYQESLAAGNEGIMFKTKDAPYKPGSRVGYMVKLKPVMDTLDLVVTQATWGEGKRAAWLTSFVLACIDENGQLLEIGRCGTGFKELENELELNSGDENSTASSGKIPADEKNTADARQKSGEDFVDAPDAADAAGAADVSFAHMTKLIEPLIISKHGKDVMIKPELVLEIAYEEIQKSTSYSSGYALRFPRVIGLRDTRSIDNASTIDVVEDYFYAQKKRQ